MLYLDGAGMLHEPDLTALGNYCAAVGELGELRRRRARALRARPRDEAQLLRLDGAIDRKAGLVRQLAAEFGFTPAGRVGLKVEDPAVPPAVPAKGGPHDGGDGGGRPVTDIGRFFRASQLDRQGAGGDAVDAGG